MASMPTSDIKAVRPSTYFWCHSSLHAYKKHIAPAASAEKAGLDRFNDLK